MKLRYNLDQAIDANESIAFQGRTLFDKLTERLTYIRENRLYTAEGIKDARLAEVIGKETNLNLTITVEPSTHVNAWVMPPIIDANHPFYESWVRDLIVTNKDYRKDAIGFIREAGGKVTGAVDRKTGKVYGIFADWEIPVGITMGMLQNNQFTPGEIAAVILHELGHVVTYFEYMSRVVTMNQILAAVSSVCLESDSYDLREQVIAESAEALGVEVDAKKLASAADPKKRADSVTVTLLSARVESSHSTTGTNIYDVRSWEQLADVYATRHGAGRELATGLDKIYRHYGSAAVLSWPEFMAFETLKVCLVGGVVAGSVGLAFMGLTAFMALPAALLMMFLAVDTNKKIYDDPEQRIASIRRQVTEELKLKHLTSERRKVILADLDAISKVESEMRDKMPFFDVLSNYLIPWHYSSYKKEQTQKQLEEMLSNPLFITAAKFKSEGA